MADSKFGTNMAYFLAGLGIGVTVALLFAPESGEETRRVIAAKAGEGKDYVTAKGRELREQAEEWVEKGKDLVSKQKDRLADALEAGKETARRTIAG